MSFGVRLCCLLFLDDRLIVLLTEEACRARGERECNAGVLLLTTEDDGDGGCVRELQVHECHGVDC